MRVPLGIGSPIVTRVPGRHARWEGDAGIDELAEVAHAADRLGFHHLTCSEHVGVPTESARQRGGTYWDPLATLGYLAAVTMRIRLATNVLVLGYHHPLEIVKRYGTLDEVSKGRLILGVGVGSLEEEFELIGAPFENRGERADDALRAIRQSFGRRRPSYSGNHYEYTDWFVDPAGRQAPPPIWVGGRTARSLRRAVDLGSGWAPFALSPYELRRLLRARALPAGFDVVLSVAPAVDPMAKPNDCVEAIEELQGVGATVVSCNIFSTSLEHYLDQLEALAELWELVPHDERG